MSSLDVQPYHFVISAPRSGSTWLTQALNQHPEIYATENRLFGLFCDLWKNPGGRMAPRITADQYVRSLSHHSFVSELGFAGPREFQTEFLPEYLRFLVDFLRHRSSKPVIVDKVTPYPGTCNKVLGQIAALCPESKVIQLIRDGRDVAVSGVFDWISRENEGSDRHCVFVLGESGIRLKRFFDDDLIGRWASIWKEPILALEKNQEQVNSAIEIRYEKMLHDHAFELARVFRELNLNHHPQLAADCASRVTFQVKTGRKPGETANLAKTRKGISGDWKNFFTKADAALFDELAGDLLLQLGYEPDRSWIDQCPDALDNCN